MKKKNRNITKIVARTFGILFIVLGSIVISFSILLVFRSEQILKNQLSKIVYEKSDSTYQLNFETIEVDFFKRHIKINSPELTTNLNLKDDSTKRHLNFYSPSIIIEGIDYLELISQLRFRANKLSVESPKFSMASEKEVGLNQLSEKALNMGDTLKIPIFSEIVFDTLLVIDARLNIDSIFLEKYQLPKVNIEVINFKLGGIKQTPTPFPFDVDDLSLKVESITNELADSLHLLTIGQINLSLMHSSIKARNVHLSAKPNITVSNDNIFTLEIPEIVLHGKEVEKIFFSDTLTIDSLMMKNPTIQIKFGKLSNGGTPPNEINLYKLFEKRWDWVNLKQLSITNGDVKLIPHNTNTEAQHFEKLNVVFSDFVVDPNSYRDQTRILSAKSLKATLGKFTLYHTDKVHTLSIEDIVANTPDQLLTSGTVTFKPIAKHKKANTLIDIRSKSMAFYGFDYLTLFHKQILPMREMVINSPIANVKFDRPEKSTKAQHDKSLILEKTRDYLTGIYVGTARFVKGSLEYNYLNQEDKPGFFKSDFDFELRKLSIDSTTFYQTDKIFFANDFQVEFSNIDLQLADNRHKLATKSIRLSSFNHSAEIIDFIISPMKSHGTSDSVSSSETFNIVFPKINFNGANLHKAFFEKNLYIENFIIENPTFSFDKKGDWKSPAEPEQAYQSTIYSLIDSYLENIQIKNLVMEKGNVKLNQKDKKNRVFTFTNAFSVKMTNFELNSSSESNKNKLFFSDAIDLVLKNQELNLADGVHKVNADEIGILSSVGEIYIKNARLSPNISSSNFKKLPMAIYANIPEMSIKSANIIELINKGNFNSGVIGFVVPEIKIVLQENFNNAQIQEQAKPILLLDGLKNLSSKKIKIDNGIIELVNYGNGKSTILSKANISFDMDNFNINLNNNNYGTKYSNYKVTLSDFNYYLPDNTHQIHSNTLSYTLNNKMLEVLDFSISPLTKTTKSKQYFRISMPDIRLIDFDPEELIRNKKLLASSLFLNKPTISIEGEIAETNKKFSPYDIDLYSTWKTVFENFEIKDVSLKNANVYLKGKNPIMFENFDFSAQNFKVDATSKKANKLLYSDKFNFKSSPIKGKTPDEYYTYSINNITINEKGDFAINELELKPVFIPKEFVRLKKYQEDYFNIDKADFKGTGLDIKMFFEKDQIWIDNLQAVFSDTKIHRDKTVPIDPNSFLKLPQHALRDLKQKINIKNANVTCNNLLFTELLVDGQPMNQILVTGINAQIRNITNIKEQMTINRFMNAKIDGYLMGKCGAHIDIDFNLPAPNNEFTLRAICDSVPLSVFNPITEPGLKLQVKDGHNKKLETYFVANEDSSIGKLTFAYSNLKVSVLTEKRGTIKEDKFTSFLANTLVKSENPKAGKEIEPVEVKHIRNKQRSVVSYIWRTVFSGLKNTLGIKNDTDDE